MEVMQEVKGYSDSREELEEEEEAAEEIITREGSSSSISRLHHHQDAASNFINHTARKQLDFIDLSLGTNHHHHEANNFQGSLGHHFAATSTSTSSSSYANNNHLNNQPVEKEHMFDKVVTPSDVGKLNRLVIPKQHAEKYFPLDSNANEKGLLLNFEDRNGKSWRFRYSYWNSSQSYVMTKGWSRFVKEKKLDAGDIVSFQRGVGELYRHRLYIDWRRRPEHHHHHLHHHGHGPLDYPSSTTLITPFFLPNQQHLPSNYSIRWGTGRLYPLPSQQQAPQRNHNHDQQHFQHLNYNNMYPFHHHHHHQQQQQQHGGGSLSHHYGYNNDVNSSGSGSVYYLRSTTPSMPMADTTTRQQQQQEGGNNIAPIIIDSVPVAHHHQNHNHNHHGGSVSGNSSNNNSTSTAAKRLRLFGVNMECASSTAQEDSKSSSSLPQLQLLNEEPQLSSSSAAAATRFGDQRGGAAMVFDLDPSLQYHHQ